MAGLVDAFSLILKKSLNWRLWFYLFIISLVGMFAFGVCFVVFILLGLMVYFLLGITLPALILYFILIILFLVVMFVFSSAIQGTSLNFTRAFLEKEKFDLWVAWGKTKPRIFTAIKVEILVGLFYLIIFLLCLLPFIFALSNFLYSVTLMELLTGGFSISNAVFSLLVPLLVSFGLMFLVFLIFTPFSVVYGSVPFFESLGTFGSIKRAIHLAKNNYFRNLGFFLIFMLFIFAVTVVYMILVFVLSLPMSFASGAGSAIVLVIVLVLFRVIVETIYSIWISVLSMLFSTEIYLLDTENEKSNIVSVSSGFLAKPFSKPVSRPFSKPFSKPVSKPSSKPVPKPSANPTPFPESFLKKPSAKLKSDVLKKSFKKSPAKKTLKKK